VLACFAVCMKRGKCALVETIKVCAVLLCAGRGLRMNSSTPKQFMLLAGKPLLVWAAQVLDASEHVDSIVIVAPEQDEGIDALCDRYSIKKVAAIVVGGATRQQSVCNALKAVPKNCGLVLVHDAARPFLSEKMIEDTVIAAAIHGAVLTAVPSSDCLKLVDAERSVQATLDRSSIWRAQTPQVFNRQILEAAHERFGHNPEPAADDAELVERLGHRVFIVHGSERNIKVTTPEDWALALALATCEEATR